MGPIDQPARRIGVTRPVADALPIVLASLAASGFHRSDRTAGSAIVLKHGSYVGDVVLTAVGIASRLGPFGRLGWMTVDADDDGVTLSLTRNYQLSGIFREAVGRVVDDLAAAGRLTDAGAFGSAHDLPATAPGNPATYRRLVR